MQKSRYLVCSVYLGPKGVAGKRSILISNVKIVIFIVLHLTSAYEY